MKELKKDNYSRFVIRNLARFSLSALLGIVLIGESVSAIPKSVGVEIAQQQSVTDTENREVLRVEAQRLSIEGMQLFNQGTLQSLKQAISKWEKALFLWQKVEDKRWQTTIVLGIGRIYDDLGDKQQSQKFYEQALQLNSSTGDKSERATILNNLGKVHNDLGNRKEALKSYNQALQILPLNGSIEDEAQKATTLSNIGFVYKDLGDFQQALKFYNQALPLMQKVKDKSGEAKTRNNIAGIYDSFGDKQKALNFYNQALSLSQEVNDKNAEAATLNNIGFVYKDLVNFKKSLEKLNQALRLRKEIGDKSGEAITRNNLGTVHFLLEDKKQALEFYKQALPLNREVEDKNGEAITLHNIAKTHRDNGNLQTALTNSKAAVDIIENLRTKVDSNELRTSYFATVQDIYKLHIDILMQLHKQNPSLGYDAQALAASEKSRARGLLELLTEANADIRKGVNPELVAQEKRLQQLINSKEKLRLETVSDKNKSDNLISKDAAQRYKKEVQNHINELNQLKAKIKTTSPKYAALKYPEPLNLPKIQQQLDKDTVLLQYSLGEKRSYLWKVTPDSLDSYELPKSQQIEETANKLRNLLQDPSMQGVSPQETGKAATELSKLILAPVADKLGKKRLVIVGDDALQYIPFAALADLNSEQRQSLYTKDSQPEARNQLEQRDINYQPLLINHEIVHLPSASTIDILRKETAQRPIAPKTLAVLADPVFHKDDKRVTGKTDSSSNNIDDIDVEALRSSLRNFNLNEIHALPNTRKEAEEILKLVSPENSLKAFDFDANYNWATQKQLSNYRYLHFATHGFVHPTDPKLSGIVLSLLDKQGDRQSSGFLRLHELFNLNFPAELVVLSACKTGLGKEVKGEGLVGLTRGLMYAGAERVVVSLWNVKDDATSLLMRQFFKKCYRKENRQLQH